MSRTDAQNGRDFHFKLQERLLNEGSGQKQDFV
jgi:hypothetical protein